MLIDTHCHLNDREAFPDPQAAISEANAAGVDRLIVVGVDADDSQAALDLAEAHEDVYAIVGWHPNYTTSYSRSRLDEIQALAKHPKAVAIGEIGLDFHWNYASLEQQKAALLDQLDLAAELEKPVVFHCREAYSSLLDILEQRPARPYLFHCFSGNAEDARRAMDLGCYFGVDGPITYKKSSTLREIVRSLPHDRLVLETDSPYLSPEPFRGKPNKPANVVYVNGGLASTLGISPDECAALTTANARRFFGI